MNVVNHFVEKGSGEILILLHGNNESHSYFENQIEEFSQYFKVLAIDTRGHGGTPRGTKPFTLIQFADDLLAFMDNRKIQKAHILGFSDGANVALIFALKHPERVEKLVLNAANLYPLGLKQNIKKSIDWDYRLTRIRSIFKIEAQKDLEMLSLMVKEPNISEKDLTKLNLLTMVIVGDDDMIEEAHSRLIADKLPRSCFTIIKGSHFVARENPKEFNPAVLNFLKNF